MFLCLDFFFPPTIWIPHPLTAHVAFPSLRTQPWNSQPPLPHAIFSSPPPTQGPTHSLWKRWHSWFSLRATKYDIFITDNLENSEKYQREYKNHLQCKALEAVTFSWHIILCLFDTLTNTSSFVFIFLVETMLAVQFINFAETERFHESRNVIYFVHLLFVYVVVLNKYLLEKWIYNCFHLIQCNHSSIFVYSLNCCYF